MPVTSEELAGWGYDETWESRFRALKAPELDVARVTVGYRRLYDVVTASGPVNAVGLLGRFAFMHDEPSAYPVVGDWVGVDLSTASPLIHAVLPRRSAFTRKAAGRRNDAQVVAANIDTIFLVTASDQDFNPRRLERYLTLAASTGATPVLIVNKADLDHDVTLELHGVAKHRISALRGDGLEALASYFRSGETVALLGASGVGKSTLVNRILGRDVQHTRGLRRDGRGRHTTTNRHLFRVPRGGLILDTPGMRELHLWEGEDGIDDVFAEISELAVQCRFRDCRHLNEPGCAVQAAIARGAIDRTRLKAYQKLAAEAAEEPWSASRRGR